MRGTYRPPCGSQRWPGCCWVLEEDPQTHCVTMLVLWILGFFWFMTIPSWNISAGIDAEVTKPVVDFNKTPVVYLTPVIVSYTFKLNGL